MAARERDADSGVQHREISATKEYYKRILESLYFPDIHARQEGIDEAHKQTFEWIFDRLGNEVRPWDHFVDWLEEGRGTYWISGKAGSGKSTLMSFICHDSRTDEALRIWSGTNEVFKPSFFFWSPGSQLQKSLAGLLRSLIYQIVGRFPDLMPMLANSMGPSQHGFHQLPTWTEQRLRATLQNLLSVGLEQYRLCIFIDGLDEFHGNHATLLDLIRNLGRSTRVKFCLSSRPYRPFKDELGSSHMLKLHDLTEPDIRRYVSDKLKGVSLKASQIPYSSSTIEDTIDIILQKAEGVFLWVNLAVRDQLEGIRNGDDAEQLRERLEILPTEIEEVYGHMLLGVDKVYQKEVARYVGSVLQEGSWSLFGFALAEHKRIDDIVLFSPDISIYDIRQHCKSIEERIATTCKGFLEVRKEIDFEEWQIRVTAPSSYDPGPWEYFAKSLKDWNIPLKQREELTELEFLRTCNRVEFLHRTAFDFFKNNEQGKGFLKVNTSANSHPQMLRVKALLADLIVFPVSPDDDDVTNSLDGIMFSASIAEDETGVAQPALMDLVDRSITKLCERSRGLAPDIHWCKVWYPSRYYPADRISYPVDFLGFAAWYGLSKYVEHILGSQSGQPTADITDYLLRCFVDGLEWHYRGELKLIPILLKRGADPNVGTLNNTVWGLFLLVLYGRCSHQDQDSVDFLSESARHSVKAFLGSGANVNEEIHCRLNRSLASQNVTHSVNSPSIVMTSYMIRVRLSARSVLQQLYAKSPNFFEIEDTLIASGASLSLQCTDLIVTVEVDSFHIVDVDSKLSMEQLKLLTDTCEKYLHATKEPWAQRLEMLDPHVRELFQELDIEQLCEQDKELESSPPQEEHSQEDKSSTNTDRISDEPSIDTADSAPCEAREHPHSSNSSQEEN